MSLYDIVHEAVTTGHQAHGKEGEQADQPLSGEKSSTPPPKNLDSPTSRSTQPKLSIRKGSLPDTPAFRTGPPRSISYNYSIGQVPASRQTSQHENGEIAEGDPGAEDGQFPFMQRQESEFRGALEFNSPEQREREKEAAEKKGKKRESKHLHPDETWNPIKWFQGSPEEEKAGFDFPQAEDRKSPGTNSRNQTLDSDAGPSKGKKRTESGLQRSLSLPQDKAEKTARGPAKWGRLKSLLPQVASQGKHAAHGQTAINPQSVNIADELMVGGLSTMMLRLWFERDEKDRRRIPFLFHRLRIRISDSLHPMQGNKSVFRIECEYANGAARWVVYRQLRDFISLHTHYTISNAYNRNVEAMPEFPRTSKCACRCL